jgi:hypothetical protein
LIYTVQICGRSFSRKLFEIPKIRSKSRLFSGSQKGTSDRGVVSIEFQAKSNFNTQVMQKN